jgi:hypothetical protein
MALKDKDGILNERARAILASGDPEVGALLERMLRILENQARRIASLERSVERSVEQASLGRRSPVTADALFRDLFGGGFGDTR